jgi:Carboxypeptidase regulatory-like domain
MSPFTAALNASYSTSGRPRGIFIALALFICLAGTASSQTVFSGTPQAIDNGINTGITGQYTSHAIVNGNPAISYYDATNGDLKFVRALDANGTSWGAPVTLDSTGIVGTYTSLVVVNGNPAISYADVSNSDLKYVRALDVNGTTWGAPVTLDSTLSVGTYTSLAVVNGNPAISYYDQTNSDLKYIRSTDASGMTLAVWGTPVTLASNGIVGQHTSLVVVNGNPAISYYDQTNNYLKYIRSTDASGMTLAAWGTPVTLDSTVNVGFYTSLAIVGGNPAISYQDVTNGDLKYIRSTDASGMTFAAWGTPVKLDSTGTVGLYTSLAVVNGNPAISYYDQTNLDLKYIRALDTSGTSWGTPAAIDVGFGGQVGQYTSQAIINGNPAISYYDVAEQNLRYVRALDASGATWAPPVTLDSTGTVGQYTSLAIVGGNPAISYYDNSTGDLKYVRANDANGTTWGAPVTLDSTGTVGQYTSLAIVGGNPAISYYDNSTGDLKYIRANDANGTSWGAPVTLDSTGFVGTYTSLVVVNGNPAISYYDQTNGDLKFVRSTYTSVSGTGSGDWDDPATWGGTVPAANSDVYLAGSASPANTSVTAADVIIRDLTLGANRTVTISGNHTLTIKGTLSMNGGSITAAPGSRVVFACNAGVTGASSADFIVGDVEKQFCAPGTFTYPVGETSGTAEYSPMTATVTALATNPSSLTVSLTDDFLPGVVQHDAVSRYWTVTETGDLTANMTFTYLDSDVNGNESLYKVFKRENGSTVPIAPSTSSPAANTASVTGVSNFSDWGIGALTPTAAAVNVGGRISDANGYGVSRAMVTMTDHNGQIRTALTNPFGYYRFDNVTVGGTYILNVTSKQHQFGSQVVTVEDEMMVINFTGQ